MKKYILLITVAGLKFFGCEDKVEEKFVSEVPNSFTKKVLIEEFTGTWCGYCPDGADRLEDIITNNDGNVIGVSTHSGDAMEVEQTYFLETTYQNLGYPSGMVDRISFDGYVSLNRGYWDFIASNQLSNTASCGLAIKSNVSGSNATVEVHAGFASSHSGEHRLSVYLIEDGVTGTGTGFDQMNFYNSDSSSSFFELGNPIIGYEHNHTLRAVLSEPLGNEISNAKLISGGEFIETYEIDISSFNKNNLSIVAFISYVGDTYLEHEVLNVQECNINGFQDWD